MRDNGWLEKQLQYLLKKNFADVVISNPLEIKFGMEAKYRFGSIRLLKSTKGTRSTKSIKGFLPNFLKARGTRDTLGARGTLKASERPAKSIITITSMFAKESVPVAVVQYTIAHELCHYAHGFSSANRRLFKYPHHGGIVNKELTRRGAHHLISAFKKWLKIYRAQILSGRISV